MSETNLIPASVLSRGVRRRRVRAMAVVGVLCMAASLAAAAVVSLTPDGHGARLTERLARLDSDNQTRRTGVEECERALESAAARLDADRCLGPQPDLGKVLVVAAAAAETKAVLSFVGMESVLPPPPKKDKDAEKPGDKAEEKPAESARPTAPTGFVIRVRGHAKTQREVTEVAENLENTGLFDRVRVAESRASDRDEDRLVAFTIECTVGKSTSSAPGAGGRK